MLYTVLGREDRGHRPTGHKGNSFFSVKNRRTTKADLQVDDQGLGETNHYVYSDE